MSLTYTCGRGASVSQFGLVSSVFALSKAKAALTRLFPAKIPVTAPKKVQIKFESKLTGQQGRGFEKQQEEVALKIPVILMRFICHFYRFL